MLFSCSVKWESLWGAYDGYLGVDPLIRDVHLDHIRFAILGISEIQNLCVGQNDRVRAAGRHSICRYKEQSCATSHGLVGSSRQRSSRIDVLRVLLQGLGAGCEDTTYCLPHMEF